MFFLSGGRWGGGGRVVYFVLVDLIFGFFESSFYGFRFL